MNAYTNELCGDGDYWEIRLITNECIYSDWYKWQQLECDEHNAKTSYYETMTPQCSDFYMTNSTLVTGGELDGETVRMSVE